MMDTDKNITEETEKKDTLILAIESSCDETAASVVKNGREVLSNVISSQIALHTQFGGVVPEIASRKHIEKINQVVTQALEDAKVTLADVDAIGVTYGPGLVLSLIHISDLLHIVAVYKANILTIHQSIPVNGVATLTLSVEVRDNTGNISKMVEEIEEQNGIHYVKIVSRE